MAGQPVSFTDFYGYLVGQQILKGRMKSKLSDKQSEILSGKAPLPLFTSLHVKSNISAKVYQEWCEFNPFEFTMHKYGVSCDIEHFGSKFYMGSRVRSFPEVPMHFLQGIWGSAFSILFKRLVQYKNGSDSVELILEQIGEDDNGLGPGFEPSRYLRIQTS